MTMKCFVQCKALLCITNLIVLQLKRSLTSDDDLLRKGSTTSLSSLGSLADTSARYAATISAETPLQVTLSKKSLTLIKDVVEVCILCTYVCM